MVISYYMVILWLVMVFVVFWLVVDLPLWKMMEWKSVGMIFHSQLFLESHSKFHGSSQHQAVLGPWTTPCSNFDLMFLDRFQHVPPCSAEVSWGITVPVAGIADVLQQFFLRIPGWHPWVGENGTSRWWNLFRLRMEIWARIWTRCIMGLGSIYI